MPPHVPLDEIAHHVGDPFVAQFGDPNGVTPRPVVDPEVPVAHGGGHRSRPYRGRVVVSNDGHPPSIAVVVRS